MVIIDAIDDATTAATASTASGPATSSITPAWIRSLKIQLCQLVVDLPMPTSETSSSPSSISEALDPFFSSLLEDLSQLSNNEFGEGCLGDYDYKKDDGDYDDNMDGINPLILACDKGNIECLRYLCQRTEQYASTSTLATAANVVLEEIIGSPLYSKTTRDKNTTFHHATTKAAAKTWSRVTSNDNGELSSSSSSSFLQVLEKIAIAQLAARPIPPPRNDNYNIILSLGAAVNSHNDTPLMMAMAKNVYATDNDNNGEGEHTSSSSALIFLETWYRLAVDRARTRCSCSCSCSSKDDLNGIMIAIRTVLCAKNDSGDSVVQYAWSHGIVDVIEFLIRIDNDKDKDDDKDNESSGGDITTENDGKNAPIMMISTDDVLRCRKTLLAMEHQWNIFIKNRKNMINADQEERYKKERYGVEQCLILMEGHVVERSECIAQELLRGLEDDDKANRKISGGNVNNKKKKSKQKKKKKKQRQRQKQPSANTKSSSEVVVEVDDVSSEIPLIASLAAALDYNGDVVDDNSGNSDVNGDAVFLTKLADGTLAVRVSGHDDDENEDEEQDERLRTGLLENVTPTSFRKRTMSLDETNKMLRDRYKGSSQSSTIKNATAIAGENSKSKNSTIASTDAATTTATTATSSSFSDVDSVLSALCLDVNCLLYSDHGMALNLSPAQLDAVQQILEEQLQSVRKARALQQRRCAAAAHGNNQ